MDASKPVKRCNIYLTVDDDGRIKEWAYHIRNGDITVGVTKQTMNPDTYAAGWTVLFDEKDEQGFEVTVYTHDANRRPVGSVNNVN